jgi:hypothetical protein
MGAAQYRIGPSDTFTPGDLAADADTLDGQISVLDLASDGNEGVTEQLFTTWDLWKLKFRAWKADNFGGFLSDLTTALNDSNRDQLVAYENEFVNFAQQFQAAGVQIPGSIVQPSSGSQDGLWNHLKNALGVSTGELVLALVGIVVAIALAKKII